MSGTKTPGKNQSLKRKPNQCHMEKQIKKELTTEERIQILINDAYRIRSELHYISGWIGGGENEQLHHILSTEFQYLQESCKYLIGQINAIQSVRKRSQSLGAGKGWV